MQGEESLSFVEPDLSPDQAEVLRNSASNVPEFKNKMAKQVLKAITHKPQTLVLGATKLFLVGIACRG